MSGNLTKEPRADAAAVSVLLFFTIPSKKGIANPEKKEHVGVEMLVLEV